MIDCRKFKEDLDAAQNEAEYLKTIPDDGTCNFDSLHVMLGRNTPSLRAEMKKLGVEIYPEYTNWFYVRLRAYSYGQGYRRTKMVETVCSKMREKGWGARVRYVMD